MVYAVERGKYSYSGVRRLSGATSPETLANITSNSAIGCISNRNTKRYTVGWGINSYFIFNDGPGPHKTGTYDSTYLNNPYELKSTVGTSKLKQQCQSESQFVIGSTPTPTENIVFTLKVTNNYTQTAYFNGEMYFYMERATHDDYDNTGKGAGDNPPGILLDGYTSNGYNNISIGVG